MKLRIVVAMALAGVALAAFPGRPLMPAAARAAEAADRHVIRPEYDNRVFGAARRARPDILIARVEDRRGVPADQIGRTGEGMRASRENALVLSEPVADFVKRSFETILRADAPDPDPIRVALGIEVLDLSYTLSGWWIFRGPKEAGVQARVSVSVLSDDGAVAAGALQTEMKASVLGTLEGAQRSLLYRGIAALALGLAEGEVKLSRPAPGAASPVAATPDIATPAASAPEAPAGRPSGASADARPAFGPADPVLMGPTVADPGLSPPVPRTASVEWSRIRSKKANLWGEGGVYPLYLGLSTSSMQRALRGLWGGSFEYVSMPERGRGHRVSIGYLQASGTPDPRDPQIQMTTCELDLWEIPIEGAILFRLPAGSSDRWRPYVSLGGTLFVGSERVKFEAVAPGAFLGAESRTVTDAFAFHAGLGTMARATSRIYLMAESRWLQGGPGSREFLASEPFPTMMNTFLALPDLNHTAWGIAVGLYGEVW